MPYPTRTAPALFALFALGTASAASATPFTATDVSSAQAILAGFNAVAANAYANGSETEGRVVAGGSLTNTGGGNANYCYNGCSGTATVAGNVFGAVTVYGDVNGPGTLDVMNGNAAIAGSLKAANSEFNHNGGVSFGGSNTGRISDATYVRTASASAGATQNVSTGTVTTNSATAFDYGSFASLFSTPLNDLVTAVATIVGTLGNVQAIADNTNNYSSTASAATGGKWASSYSYGFYTTTADALAHAQNFAGINAGSLSAVFVVVAGNGAVSLPRVQNGASKVIWVLPNATSVTLTGQFDGTVLAPLASFTNTGGNMDALAYAASITQVNEFHKTSQFSGDITGLAAYADPAIAIPEPASLALLAAGGLAGLTLTRRRRAVRAASRI